MPLNFIQIHRPGEYSGCVEEPRRRRLILPTLGYDAGDDYRLASLLNDGGGEKHGDGVEIARSENSCDSDDLHSRRY